MSSTDAAAGTPPWRNGFWFNEKMPCTVIIVDGEKFDFNNMIGLDFPDIEGSVTMVGKFGEFGAAKKGNIYTCDVHRLNHSGEKFK